MISDEPIPIKGHPWSPPDAVPSPSSQPAVQIRSARNGTDQGSDACAVSMTGTDTQLLKLAEVGTGEHPLNLAFGPYEFSEPKDYVSLSIPGREQRHGDPEQLEQILPQCRRLSLPGGTAPKRNLVELTTPST
jgi:hypothetical protein